MNVTTASKESGSTVIDSYEMENRVSTNALITPTFKKSTIQQPSTTNADTETLETKATSKYSTITVPYSIPTSKSKGIAADTESSGDDQHSPEQIQRPTVVMQSDENYSPSQSSNPTRVNTVSEMTKIPEYVPTTENVMQSKNYSETISSNPTSHSTKEKSASSESLQQLSTQQNNIDTNMNATINQARIHGVTTPYNRSPTISSSEGNRPVSSYYTSGSIDTETTTEGPEDVVTTAVDQKNKANTDKTPTESMNNSWTSTSSASKDTTTNTGYYPSTTSSITDSKLASGIPVQTYSPDQTTVSQKTYTGKTNADSTSTKISNGQSPTQEGSGDSDLETTTTSSDTSTELATQPIRVTGIEPQTMPSNMPTFSKIPVTTASHESIESPLNTNSGTDSGYTPKVTTKRVSTVIPSITGSPNEESSGEAPSVEENTSANASSSSDETTQATNPTESASWSTAKENRTEPTSLSSVSTDLGSEMSTQATQPTAAFTETTSIATSSQVTESNKQSKSMTGIPVQTFQNEQTANTNNNGNTESPSLTTENVSSTITNSPKTSASTLNEASSGEAPTTEHGTKPNALSQTLSDAAITQTANQINEDKETSTQVTQPTTVFTEIPSIATSDQLTETTTQGKSMTGIPVQTLQTGKTESAYTKEPSSNQNSVITTRDSSAGSTSTQKPTIPQVVDSRLSGGNEGSGEQTAYASDDNNLPELAPSDTSESKEQVSTGTIKPTTLKESEYQKQPSYDPYKSYEEYLQAYYNSLNAWNNNKDGANLQSGWQKPSIDEQSNATEQPSSESGTPVSEKTIAKVSENNQSPTVKYENPSYDSIESSGFYAVDEQQKDTSEQNNAEKAQYISDGAAKVYTNSYNPTKKSTIVFSENESKTMSNSILNKNEKPSDSLPDNNKELQNDKNHREASLIDATGTPPPSSMIKKRSTSLPDEDSYTMATTQVQTTPTSVKIDDNATSDDTNVTASSTSNTGDQTYNNYVNEWRSYLMSMQEWINQYMVPLEHHKMQLHPEKHPTYGMYPKDDPDYDQKREIESYFNELEEWEVRNNVGKILQFPTVFPTTNQLQEIKPLKQIVEPSDVNGTSASPAVSGSYLNDNLQTTAHPTIARKELYFSASSSVGSIQVSSGSVKPATEATELKEKEAPPENPTERSSPSRIKDLVVQRISSVRPVGLTDVTTQALDSRVKSGSATENPTTSQIKDVVASEIPRIAPLVVEEDSEYRYTTESNLKKLTTPAYSEETSATEIPSTVASTSMNEVKGKEIDKIGMIKMF